MAKVLPESCVGCDAIGETLNSAGYCPRCQDELRIANAGDPDALEAAGL